MIDLQPKTCNLCSGRVVFTSNSKIYGKEYGSGKCYFCTECGAYVGTHIPRPTEAFGILANEEMRELKIQCHDLFDKLWKNEPTSKKRFQKRRRAYLELAKQMDIPIEECHFGFFNMDMLQKAYSILQNGFYP